MKRKISFFLCIAILVCLAGTAFGSVSFKKFTLTFKDKASFTSIVSDTTSRAMTVKNQDHARFTVNTNSSKKNVFRAYSGGVVSIEHFVKKEY